MVTKTNDLIPFKVGFVPLTDCATLVAAKEMGFAAEEGIDLILEKSTSWAAIRDRVAYGMLDAAHMLAGMPIASSLGLGSELGVNMVAPIALGQGGNAITLSMGLYREMVATDPEVMAGPRAWRGRALKKVIEKRQETDRPMIRLAAVYPFSSHNYELRYWLAAAEIHPDVDVQLSIVPPPRMVESLKSGLIDGFCVGEPWNQLAVAEEIGRIVTTKADIWPACPEKVLGLRADVAEQKSDELQALLRAILKAARWADQSDNHFELATLLAQPEYVGVSAEILFSNLSGKPRLDPYRAVRDIPRYQVFHGGLATMPWVSQARWLLNQMRRWGQASLNIPAEAADGVFRPDLYATAARAVGEPVPVSALKAEAGHQESFEVDLEDGTKAKLPADVSFDEFPFDPLDVNGYEEKFTYYTPPESLSQSDKDAS